MKAVVTIIDDDGTIIIKDNILYPQREGIDTPAFVKFARFAFEVKTVIMQGAIPARGGSGGEAEKGAEE